jgi:hypothetical protein
MSEATAATTPAATPEPVLVFVFDFKQWTTQISNLTKLEFIDYIPTICSQFFFDPSVPAYVLTLAKSKWDTLNTDAKLKFKLITRRLREEVEGTMTQVQRDQYENTDPFDAFAKKREEEAKESTQTFAESALVNKNEDNIDLKSIESALERE